MKIYYAKIDELTEEEMQLAIKILPKERIDKIKKMKQKKSKVQSVAAGLLLEYGLQEMGLCGRNMTFLRNPDGKPYVKEYSKLCYNLSHSEDYVALVLDEYPVGVDIECLRRGYQKLVKRFFSEEEAASLKDAWSDEAFTRIWTRKESYLKATGYGMRMPLDAFSTLEEEVRVNGKMCEEMLEPEAAYYLASFQVEKDYWLSVCRRNAPMIDGNASVVPKKVDLKKVW